MQSQIAERPPAVDFDHHDQGLAERIHQVYRELREDHPIQWTERHGGYWVVTGYEALHTIANDPEHFSSAGAFIPDITGGMLLIPQQIEDPEHRVYRTLLRDWFTPRRIASFEPRVRTITRQLLEQLQPPADLVSEFAVPLPVEVILRVLGVQERELKPISEAVKAITEGTGADPSAVVDGYHAAIAFIRDAVLAPLRDTPGDDLLSFLLGKQPEMEFLDDDTIARIGFSMIGAGFDTTSKTLSSSLAFFAESAELQQRARTAPLPVVVEEMLRVVAPVTSGRLVLADREVAGRQLRAGDRVLLAWPAASRDPALFADPEAVQFSGGPNPHVAFGTGIHRCLGMHLARLELRVAFEELFCAFESFTLAEGARPRFAQGPVWGAVSLPVTFVRR
ncbi:cytochrome P450 [Mycolicibacterium sp.]|uniref:cytochrome P450 n=1 Tax=Mycolicibacterium sp. TaxID=2320850 RepID=UPI003D0B8470